MTKQRLAVNGGSPEISKLASRLPFRSYQVRRGLSRSLDVLKGLSVTLRGHTSINQGGVIGRFEDAFRDYTGSKYALAMNNGTAALHSAYFAVGVGPGSEVIVPAYAWHAIATPVLMCGATPVFCEIDPDTLALDLDDLQSKINERTRAIGVLHAWGNPAPMDRIREIADRQDIAVVEDCSHAHGARYQGRAVGTWGHVGCFSLQGSKTLDGGEAGVAITDDPELFDRMVLLGHNFLVGGGGQAAQTFPFGDISLGVKYRPHPMAMTLAYHSLRGLDKRNAHATRSWEILCEEFGEGSGLRPIAAAPGGERGGYYCFVLEYQGEDRGGPPTEEFVAMAKAEGAPLELDQFRGQLLHTLPLFRSFDRRKLGGSCYDPTRPYEEQLSTAALPVTERITNRLVRFPREFNGVSHAFVRRSARAVKKVLEAVLQTPTQEALVASEGFEERVGSAAGR
jgi:dTDP-4-amino-4,6-dideoxygalactose transaminase